MLVLTNAACNFFYRNGEKLAKIERKNWKFLKFPKILEILKLNSKSTKKFSLFNLVFHCELSYGISALLASYKMISRFSGSIFLSQSPSFLTFALDDHSRVNWCIAMNFFFIVFESCKKKFTSSVTRWEKIWVREILPVYDSFVFSKFHYY